MLAFRTRPRGNQSVEKTLTYIKKVYASANEAGSSSCSAKNFLNGWLYVSACFAMMSSVAFTMASTSSPTFMLSSSVDSRVIRAVTVAGVFTLILIIAVTSPF